ncbi:MAG: hypothetical protein J0I21_16565 [Alphaproteobacteria bacterium]|nr:hypothetical protein [Alphaproteobacteria bacterium]
MAQGFDLTATARRLLSLEVNTIVRNAMTAEPMPPVPHALLDIARDYAGLLCSLGVDMNRVFAADPATLPTLAPGWVTPIGSISDRLTVASETFDRLRWAAKWAASGAAARPTPIPPPTRVLLDRIINNADAIKDIFQRFDASFNTAFLGKTRAQLLETPIKAGSYSVTPDDLILLQKMWDIGLEEIVAQTVVHVTGDVTTRVQAALRGAGSETLFAIHRQSIDISVARWKDLLAAVSEIAGTAIRAVLGGKP